MLLLRCDLRQLGRAPFAPVQRRGEPLVPGQSRHPSNCQPTHVRQVPRAHQVQVKFLPRHDHARVLDPGFAHFLRIILRFQ